MPGALEKNINLEFPLKKNDGSTVWIRSNCKKTYAPVKDDTISYLMIDITDSKVNEQALLLEKERYHIATELTNDIIFEYGIAADVSTHAAKYQQVFGRPSLIPRFVQNIDKITWVSPSTLTSLKNLCHDFRSGKPTMSAELKLMGLNQIYTWCHIKGKTIYDDAGNPYNVIGKIVNIDAQKKALEDLYNKACRDPLTGLYNKTVTKTLIDKTIHDTQLENTHAFMIIDIDNFKAFNDNFGHLAGDEVLAKTVKQLQ